MLKTLFRSSLVIALWLAWKHTAALPLCLAFWIIVLIWGVRPIASRCPSAVWVLVLIGVLSNAMVTLANSGVMPGSQIGEKIRLHLFTLGTFAARARVLRHPVGHEHPSTAPAGRA